jgi:hypothetical protein
MIFCPARLRHFNERPSASVVIFFRAAVALAVERLHHGWKAG